MCAWPLTEVQRGPQDNNNVSGCWKKLFTLVKFTHIGVKLVYKFNYDELRNSVICNL